MLALCNLQNISVQPMVSVLIVRWTGWTSAAERRVSHHSTSIDVHPESLQLKTALRAFSSENRACSRLAFKKAGPVAGMSRRAPSKGSGCRLGETALEVYLAWGLVRDVSHYGGSWLCWGLGP